MKKNQMGKICRRAASFFQMIPLNIGIDEVISVRMDRIQRIYPVLKSDNPIKYELIRYLPIATFALYEYFMRIAVYMLLNESKTFKDGYVKLAKFNANDDLIKYFNLFKINENKYLCMLLSFSRSDHAEIYLNLLKDVNSEKDDQGVTGILLDSLIVGALSEKSRNAMAWFRMMRDRFAHQSEIIDFDLEHMFGYSEYCTSMIEDIRKLAEITNMVIPNIMYKPINGLL